MGSLREWKGQREWKEMAMKRHILYINLSQRLLSTKDILAHKYFGGNAVKDSILYL